LDGDFELVAGCDRELPRAVQLSEKHGGRAYSDFDRMLDEGRLDLLIVTLPPNIRDGHAEKAAALGVNLLVEKPIALDLGKAEAIVNAAERARVIAANGFMYRFGDAVTRWKESDTGKPGLFAGSYHCNALHADWWRKKECSGGQLVEQVIHLVDLVRVFMGEPDTVYARTANLFHKSTPGYDIEDVSAILFGWDDGRIATINASNVAVPGTWRKDWCVFAEKMTGRFTGWNDAELIRTAGEASRETVAGRTDPFVAQLADLAAAIREHRQPRVTLRDGMETLKLTLAAHRSATEHRELRLRDGT
jgi:predicted dehydrogenase